MRRAAILAIILMSALTGLTSRESGLEWTAIAQSPHDVARSVIRTSDEGYAIAGYTSSSGDGSDFRLVKTNSAGNVEWDKRYNNAKYDYANSVVQTEDKGFALAGSSSRYEDGGDVWLVKTDSYGNIQWNRSFGGPITDEAYSLIQTQDGGFALAGDTRSYGAGWTDFWFLKTDVSGNLQWNKTYGGPDFETAFSVVQTQDGGYALGGDTWSNVAGKGGPWLVKVDSAGDMQWNKTYAGGGACYSLVATGDGGYAFVGESFVSAFGSSLTKTNSSGNLQWKRTYDDGQDNSARSLITTRDEGYALLGYTRPFGTSSPGDLRLIKTDAQGTMQFNRTYVSVGIGLLYSVVQTYDGGYAMTGGDFWLVKTDSIGITQWIRTYPKISPSLSPLVLGEYLLVGTVAVLGIVITVTYLYRKRRPRQ